jgi:hypothetical protein
MGLECQIWHSSGKNHIARFLYFIPIRWDFENYIARISDLVVVRRNCEKYYVRKNELHLMQKAHTKREILQTFWGNVVQGALERLAISSGMCNERLGRPELICFLECETFESLRNLHARYDRVGCEEGWMVRDKLDMKGSRMESSAMV